MKALADYLSKHKKTNIIFDFDATIFHLLLPWDHVYDPIREQLIKMDPEIFAGFERGEYHDGITREKYFKKYGEAARALIHPQLRKFEVEELRGVRVNEDLVDLIRNDNDHVMYIWSANTRKPIEDVLKEHGIFNRFKKIVTIDDVLNIKPDTEGFKHLYDNKTALSQFLLVGDSASDEGAAKALGMDFFKVQF